MLPFIEVAFGCYMTACLGISLWYGFGYAAMPFLIMFAGGYFYVGFSSFYVLWRMQQEADLSFVEPDPAGMLGL